jgi:hypothetical protein
MSIHVHAIYKAGLIHPDRPLGLPENTEVDLMVMPSHGNHRNSLESRPTIPRFSPAELRDRLSRHAVSVGTLPTDFSRADIYQDHD